MKAGEISDGLEFVRQKKVRTLPEEVIGSDWTTAAMVADKSFNLETRPS